MSKHIGSGIYMIASICEKCSSEGLSFNGLNSGLLGPKEANKCYFCDCDLEQKTSEEKRGEPGGLHMNEDGTATLYPVGIAKYKKVIGSNETVSSYFREIKENHKTFTFTRGMMDQIIEDLGGQT